MSPNRWSPCSGTYTPSAAFEWLSFVLRTARTEPRTPDDTPPKKRGEIGQLALDKSRLFKARRARGWTCALPVIEIVLVVFVTGN